MRWGNSNISKRVSDVVNSLVRSSWSVAFCCSCHSFRWEERSEDSVGWEAATPSFSSSLSPWKSLQFAQLIRRLTESRRLWRFRTERGRECSVANVINVCFSSWEWECFYGGVCLRLKDSLCLLSGEEWDSAPRRSLSIQER